MAVQDGAVCAVYLSEDPPYPYGGRGHQYSPSTESKICTSILPGFQRPPAAPPPTLQPAGAVVRESWIEARLA